MQPKLKPAQRLELIQRVKSGESVNKVCKEANISRTLFYRWLKRYKKSSVNKKLEALKPKKPDIPKRKLQTPPSKEQKVLEVVKEHPNWGPKRISENLPEGENGKPLLSPHGVYNVLKRFDLNTQDKRITYVKDNRTEQPSPAISKYSFVNQKLVFFAVVLIALLTAFSGTYSMIAMYNNQAGLAKILPGLQTEPQDWNELVSVPNNADFIFLSPDEPQEDKSKQPSIYIKKDGTGPFLKFISDSNQVLIDSTGKIAITGNLEIDGTITAGTNKISLLNKSGKIHEISDKYFASLDGTHLTNVDAKKFQGTIPSSFLRSDISDTAEAAINFTSQPGSTEVGGGPIYINPAAATANYTLLGIAVNDSQKFKVDAEGDVNIAGTLTVDGSTTFTGGSKSSGNLDMDNNLVLNIGAADTDFTSGGGLTLAGALDLNSTASLGGDITFDASTPSIAINDAETLTITDGTNTLLSIADGGTTGTLNCTNCINFDDLSDSLTLDAATTITNRLSGNLTIDLTSTGDFDIQDNGTTAFFVRDDGNVGVGTDNPGAKLEVLGAARFRFGRQTVSANTTISQPNQVVATTTHSITITLASSMLTEGNWLIIVDESGVAGEVGQAITIDTEGSETINGENTQSINDNYESFMLYTDGSNWFVAATRGTL